MEEQVLVWPTTEFEKVGRFLGFEAGGRPYLAAIFSPGALCYLPRTRAEDDPSFKQIVPYLLLRHENSLLCYERGKKGTESRLHRLLSVGIGGHVSSDDGPPGERAYRNGLARELEEEVRLETQYRESCIGLVHDDTTPVGSVHLGIVHVLDLDRPNVIPVDPALASARFRPLEELLTEVDRFETWSAFVLRAMKEVT